MNGTGASQNNEYSLWSNAPILFHSSNLYVILSVPSIAYRKLNKFLKNVVIENFEELLCINATSLASSCEPDELSISVEPSIDELSSDELSSLDELSSSPETSPLDEISS
ncbi:MAG: hypothetical protein K2N89_06725 [Lachnospiraceae bacterium]|nr:hypothetical protein [Lachnospiraceae bacterium]